MWICMHMYVFQCVYVICYIYTHIWANAFYIFCSFYEYVCMYLRIYKYVFLWESVIRTCPFLQRSASWLTSCSESWHSFKRLSLFWPVSPWATFRPSAISWRAAASPRGRGHRSEVKTFARINSIGHIFKQNLINNNNKVLVDD